MLSPSAVVQQIRLPDVLSTVAATSSISQVAAQKYPNGVHPTAMFLFASQLHPEPTFSEANTGSPPHSLVPHYNWLASSSDVSSPSCNFLRFFVVFFFFFFFFLAKLPNCHLLSVKLKD